MILSYKTGEISSLLDEVYDCKPLHVAEALEQYQPACPKEEKLLDGFRKGLPFLSEDSIMNYDYNPFCEDISEEYEEHQPVTLDRMIRYVYAFNDIISDELESTMNANIQETYAVEPTSFMFLEPGSHLFYAGDYPERFSAWFQDMVSIIIEITENE
jgi:hypothetical protein